MLVVCVSYCSSQYAQIYKKEDCEGLLVMTEKVLMSIYMYSYLFIYKKEDKGHLVVIHVAH